MSNAILIADDHSMIRKGLKLYLQINLLQQDVTEVSNCHEVMKELIKKKYTHLLLDIILADGNSLEIIPNIRRVYPNLKILVFSMQPAEVYAEALKQYQIHNYLSKTAGEDEILRELKRFIESKDDEHRPPVIQHKQNPFSTLAPRELEVMHYVLKGMGTKDIAEVLNLKMNTVSTIKSRIYEKTNAINIKELLELASLYNVSY
jgi:DNA-binding NarL/FixJ family response regulator